MPEIGPVQRTSTSKTAVPKATSTPKTAPPSKDEDVRKSLASILALSSKLNALTDEAARTVQNIEKYLNEVCSAGVTAYAMYDDEGPDAGAYYLEYRRVGPKFRIAVVYSDVNGDDVDVKAWSDASREDKIQSFEKLPELLVKIAENLQQMLEHTQETLGRVVDIITPLLPRK